MNAIKIKIYAYGCTGNDYDGKEIKQEKIIAKSSSDNRLTEFDLKNILNNIIISIKEIKALYPDEQKDMIFHHDNRLEQIKFSIEITNKENEIINTFDEQSFFEKVAIYNSLSQLIIDYCQITDDGEEGSRIWISNEYDEGPPAGTYAILALVNLDKKWISNYIEFLRTNDLDHEMEQMWDIKKIIDKYGWCNETCRLAIARNVSCCGQGGSQQFKEFLNNGLRDYLILKENKATFLKSLLQEFIDYELTDHGLKLLNGSKEYYLKWRIPELSSFESVLTKKEIKILKEKIEARWDTYQKKV